MNTIALESLTPFTLHTQDTSRFISFEGIEGSGKSTQIQLLKSFLEENNYRVIVLREPGGTKFGESLRKSILQSTLSIEPIAEAYLFASSRAQLLKEKILPYLSDKKTFIIVDRYIDSSIAYQGSARGLGVEVILKIHHHYPLNVLPAITFYLDIDIETSMQRQSTRGAEKDYFEKENIHFYENLIKGFEVCAQSFPERIRRIDAKREQVDIQDDIQSELRLRLKL